MATKAGFEPVDAKAHEALTRFFTRTDGWQPVDLGMPFDDLMRAEDEGEDLEPPGDYEMTQRRLGVRALFKFILGKGATPMDIFRQITAVMRAMHIAPFHAMTMHEVAMMEGQSPAAHSWRCKVLSGEIELAGMKGSRLPGQKSKEASESYKKCRKGNKNRLGGKKLDAAAPMANGKMANGKGAMPHGHNGKAHSRKERQGSFLAALHVTKRPKSKAGQTSFLRDLRVPKDQTQPETEPS